MNISPQTERALISLAERGYWLSVQGEKLQVVITRPGPVEALTDDLRCVLAQNRAELLQAVPALAAGAIDLTGSVVRVLFATLDTADQDRAIALRDTGNRRQVNDWFYRDYARLSREDKVIYFWAMVYGPLANGSSERSAA